MNITSYFITHRQDLLDEFFKKVKFTIDNIADCIKPFVGTPTNSNANELYFSDRNNTIRIGLDVRGKTPTNLHISEFAWMDESKQKDLFLAIDPFREAAITIESTANGIGNVFYKLCMNAKNQRGSFRLLFYGFDIEDRNESPIKWRELDDNLNEVTKEFVPTDAELEFMKGYLSAYPREKALRKLAWRRLKIETASAMGEGDAEQKFSQENPITIESAFISSGAYVFDPSLKYRFQEPIEEINGFKIYIEPTDRVCIGVDIAEGGGKGDFSAISGRCTDGRVAFQFKARVPEFVLAEKMDFILSTYKKGDARFMGTIQVENNVGLAFINECKKYPWFQFLLKSRKDDKASEENLVQRYGFRTTKQTKEMIIREYRGALYRGDIYVTRDIYDEIITYRYKDGAANSVEGNHDDLLMSDLIAHYTTLHEPFVAKYGDFKKKDSELTERELYHRTSMREAYRREMGYSDE